MLVFLALLAATNPVAYGAIPNDGLDDGTAFRAAAAFACSVNGDHLLEVPAGTWEISREPSKNGGLNLTNCVGLSIVGKGRAASRLRMLPWVMPLSSDYYLINVDGGSVDIEIADLTLDGRRDEFEANGSTAEQVHLIRTYNVQRIDVHDADLVESFGDCMKNINADDVGVVNVRCRGSRRDGINSHSLSTDVRIVASSFSDISDQHIATEGSGGNKRWTLVANSHVGNGEGFTHDLGTGAEDIILLGNTIYDGTVQSYQTDDIVIVANIATMNTNVGVPFALKGKNANGVFVGNIVNAIGLDSEASCLRIAAMDIARDASSIVVAENVCTHAGPNGFYISTGAGRFVLDANITRNIGTMSTGAGLGISALLPGSTVADVVVSDNVAVDEAVGINVNASRPFDNGAISGNSVRSTKPSSKGIYTQWGNSYGTPPPRKCRVDGNVFDTLGPKITNTPASPPYTPYPGDGCYPHGDQVP